MPLLNLPNELLIDIARRLFDTDRWCRSVEHTRTHPGKSYRVHLSRLSRTCQHLHTLLTPILHRTMSNPDDVLPWAVEKQRLETTVLALRHGADVNTPQYTTIRRSRERIFSPLELAVNVMNYDITALLLRNGATATTKVVSLASIANDVRTVALLLEHGAEPNADERDIPPLYSAAERGHTEVVKLLLGAGADTGYCGNFSNGTPLLIALAFKRFETVKLLLAAGANADAGDIFGAVPITRLRGLRGRAREEMVELLVSCGAKLKEGPEEVVLEEALVWNMWTGEDASLLAMDI